MTIRFAALFLLAVLAGSYSVSGQSTDPDFPTAITTNQVTGSITPRAITDPRKTTYYFAFDGDQGDVFINIVTRNFDGDVDIFLRDGLRSLSKIVIFSDREVNETGRIVYLRKPERLILRVQGRPPDDKPATFQIKFAGSFVALDSSENMEKPPPVVSVPVDNDAIHTTDRTDGEDRVKKSDAVRKEAADTEVRTTSRKVAPPIKDEHDVKRTDAGAQNTGKKAKKSPEDKRSESVAEKPVAKSDRDAPVDEKAKEGQAEENKKKTEVDPLASVVLVIELKDGTRIERPMSEVSRFSVNRGILTVIPKEGVTLRYSILDVARVTIEPSSVTVEPF